MKRLFVPTRGVEDWKALLAKPELHWKAGNSASATAHCWEQADGLPPEIQVALATVLGPVELLFAVPEWKTPLPGGRRESQSDVFAVVRSSRGIVTCTIEGKVSETFGPTIKEWKAGDDERVQGSDGPARNGEISEGKKKRLQYVCAVLGLPYPAPDGIRYQLMHRAAAALIEAERFQAAAAVMLVHSFSQTSQWRSDFDLFVRLLGAEPVGSRPVTVQTPSGRPLHLKWVRGEERFLAM